MEIKVYSIDKKGKNSLYNPLIEHYKKISKPFAKIETIDIFNNKIAKAQESSSLLAKQEYTKALEPFLNGYTVVLDPNAKEVDSLEFAQIFNKGIKVTFFIGGAYGFEKEFIKRANLSISFGKITMSHKLIKVVLMEQIYRGLTIVNNHPYHK